jgi:WD40 repeat protein
MNKGINLVNEYSLNNNSPIYSLCVINDAPVICVGCLSEIIVIQQDKHKRKINNKGVNIDVSQLCGNLILVSNNFCSRIFEINDDSISIYAELERNSSSSIIPLSHNRIAVYSKNNYNSIVNIYNSNTFELIVGLCYAKGKYTNINEDYCLIQLHNKEILVCVPFNNNTLQVWDLQTYQLITVFNDIYCCSSRSVTEIYNKTLLAIGNIGCITIINTLTWTVEQTITHNSIQYAYIYSVISSEHFLFSGDNSGSIHCFNVNTWELIELYNYIHNGSINCLAITKDNKHLLSGSSDGVIKVWSI